MILIERILTPWVIKYNGTCIAALDKSTAINYLSSLIGTIVSLTGFMIAALTIMITVKASLKARGFGDSANALEFLFTTDRYYEVVSVFTKAIVELVIVLTISYSFWLMISDVKSNMLFSKVLFYLTFAMFAALVRTLYILFRVLKLEKRKHPNPSMNKETNEEKQTRLLEEILHKLSEN